MDYATLKIIHVCAVVLSGCGFAARGLGGLRGAAWIRSRAARTLPHVVDTVLLLSALGMLWVVRLSPWALPWLRAKIIGLVVYIVLGAVALRRLRRLVPMSAARAADAQIRREGSGAGPAATHAGAPAADAGTPTSSPSASSRSRSRAMALGAWVLALLVFLYIVSVALTKTPRGFTIFL